MSIGVIAVLGTALYFFLDTIIKLIDSSCTEIANRILDDSIMIFAADENIFYKFIDLIPFSGSANMAGIVKGTAYGVIVLLMIISIIKSIASPFTGDDTVNPAQAAVRAAVAVVLEMAIFGASFGFASSNKFYFSGILGPIGKWFGTIMSHIGEIPKRGFNNIIELGVKSINPAVYIAWLILELAIMTSIIGAALQYVERVFSFAIYIILGPIAVAMYASKETESVCKDWMMGVLSQFMAIFISQLMWISFIIAAKNSDDSFFSIAVLLAILGVMRNSEKIIAAFGFKTMRLGDSARAVIGGAGSLMTIVSTATNAARFASHSTSKNIAGSNNSLQLPGTSPVFNNGGEFRSNTQMFGAQVGGITKSLFTGNPVQAVRNARQQTNAINTLKSSLSANSPVSASTLNQAYGLSNNTQVHALGNGKDGMMQPATVTTTDGQEIKGYVGDAAFTRGGQVEVVKDAFFASAPATTQIDSGTQLNIPSAAENSPERFISGGGPLIDANNNYVYRTSVKDVTFADIYNKEGHINVQVQDLTEKAANEPSAVPTVLDETTFEARNV